MFVKGETTNISSCLWLKQLAINHRFTRKRAHFLLQKKLNDFCRKLMKGRRRNVWLTIDFYPPTNISPFQSKLNWRKNILSKLSKTKFNILVFFTKRLVLGTATLNTMALTLTTHSIVLGKWYSLHITTKCLKTLFILLALSLPTSNPSKAKFGNFNIFCK
jgi:hypothetical protein